MTDTAMSMVERVARSMLLAIDKNVVYVGDEEDPQSVMVDGWVDFNALARAAILAMEEPTPEMIAAGWQVVNAEKRKAGIARLGPGPALSDGYRAMIRKAAES